MRHIISLLLENEPGALCRVAGLFSARGYNIESLSVAPTEDTSISRMTLVTVDNAGDVVEQITKQLNKLVDVVKLIDITETRHVERELMIAKIKASEKSKDELIRLSDIFRGRILDVTDGTYIIEVTGDCEKLDAFLRALDGNVILEVVRSGPLGLARGEKALRL